MRIEIAYICKMENEEGIKGVLKVTYITSPLQL